MQHHHNLEMETYIVAFYGQNGYHINKRQTLWIQLCTMYKWKTFNGMFNVQMTSIYTKGTNSWVLDNALRESGKILIGSLYG
jgi:hypothetical protein